MSRIVGTFESQGTLGLKFLPLDVANSTGVKVKAINPGTQAAEMPQLQAGMIMVSDALVERSPLPSASVHPALHVLPLPLDLLIQLCKIYVLR